MSRVTQRGLAVRTQYAQAMPAMPVAVVTDTTHYLPRELVAGRGIHEVSLYVNEGGAITKESDMPDFDAFYDGLRTSADLPTTSQPSIGDFLAVYEPLVAAATTSSRSTSPAASRARSSRRARPRPSSRRPAPHRGRRLAAARAAGSASSSSRRRRPRDGGADVEQVAQRARDAIERDGGLVLGRHAGVPAARRAHRRARRRGSAAR